MNNDRWHGIALLVIAILFLLGPRLGAHVSAPRMYWAALILMAIFTLVAGHWVTGVWRGAFINDRNRISLSQFQLVLWTVVVLGAFVTMALVNLSLGVEEPLRIEVPEALWIVMGISTTSLIGTPLISSGKKSRAGTVEEQAIAMNKLVDQGRDANDLDTEGRLVANAKPKDARWRDLFEAEELSRAGRLDIAKVQMFYFTALLVLAYGTSLITHIGREWPAGIRAFPALDESMIALLGISHAGYLTNKAVPEREGT